MHSIGSFPKMEHVGAEEQRSPLGSEPACMAPAMGGGALCEMNLPDARVVGFLGWGGYPGVTLGYLLFTSHVGCCQSRHSCSPGVQGRGGARKWGRPLFPGKEPPGEPTAPAITFPAQLEGLSLQGGVLLRASRKGRVSPHTRSAWSCGQWRLHTRGRGQEGPPSLPGQLSQPASDRVPHSGAPPSFRRAGGPQGTKRWRMFQTPPSISPWDLTVSLRQYLASQANRNHSGRNKSKRALFSPIDPK